METFGFFVVVFSFFLFSPSNVSQKCKFKTVPVDFFLIFFGVMCGHLRVACDSYLVWDAEAVKGCLAS